MSNTKLTNIKSGISISLVKIIIIDLSGCLIANIENKILVDTQSIF